MGEKVEGRLFQRCVELLKMGSIAGKLDALLFIQDIIISENKENKKFLVTKSDYLFEAIKTVLETLLSRPKTKVPVKFLIYFLNFIHKLVTIKSFLKVIAAMIQNNNFLGNICEYIEGFL